MSPDMIVPLAILLGVSTFVMLGILFLQSWQRNHRIEHEMKRAEFERTSKRQEEEEKRLAEEREEARHKQWVRERDEEDALVREKAGAGSGGYVFLDLPDDKRSLFHDLLKGFEEYARLKGYSVSFSVDSTFARKIAFKFTLTDPDVVLSTEKVRKDLTEYLEKVSSGELMNALDDLPEIISMEEHHLVVTTLKNRITFLQVNFNIAKNTLELYQNMAYRLSTQPFVAPSIVVQTGGAFNAPSFSAVNSPQAVLGIENSSSKNSIRIATTYKDRITQINLLSEVIRKVEKEIPEPNRDEVIRNLTNVKEELEQDIPEPGRVAGWLERAKEAMHLASLGHETVAAVKHLLSVFGVI